VEEVDEPCAGEGEVIVDVLLTGICGSDLHTYHGQGFGRVAPLVLGHEAVGQVGGEGEIFAIFPLEGCRKCRICQGGLENLCPDRSLLGFHRPGTFAERVAVPESGLVPIPQGLSPEVAVLAEPLANGVSVIEKATTEDSIPLENVAVIGCGGIGLLALYALRCHAPNIDVAVVDPVPSRLDVAGDLGATRTYESADELPAGQADVVIDAVGVAETWNAGLRAGRPGATVVVIGLGQAAGDIEIREMTRRGLTLRGSYGYSRRNFQDGLHMLAATPPPLNFVKRIPLAEGPEAFRLLAERPEQAIKLILDPTRWDR
jgi:threonine dehydrogenase-like Zn-dependent dehydrogenase